MYHFGTFFLFVFCLSSFLTTEVAGRLSLLRISHWQKQTNPYDEGTPDDGSIRRRETLSSIASTGGLSPNHMHGISPFHMGHQDEDAEEWDYEKKSHDDIQRELDQRMDAQRAMRELLAFGMPVAYSQSFSFSHSYSYSFEYSMSFPVDETPPPTTSKPSLQLFTSPPTAAPTSGSTNNEPSLAPVAFDFLPDVGDIFTYSFSMGVPGDDKIDDSPTVKTVAPSPSPTLKGAPVSSAPIDPSPSPPTLAPTQAFPTPSSTPTTFSSSAIAPTDVDVGGKNSGGSPSNTDVPNIEDGADSKSFGGINNEDELNPDGDGGDDKAQATMIAVLVGAVVAVGAALLVKQWHQRAQGSSSMADNPSEVSSQLSGEGQPLSGGADLA